MTRARGNLREPGQRQRDMQGGREAILTQDLPPKLLEGVQSLLKRREMQRTERAILTQQLPPKLRGRVQSLLNDLAANDFSMALLDLAQLYRALTADDPSLPGGATCSSGSTASTRIRTLIYAADEAAVEHVCFGPRPDGRCPRALRRSPVACAGRWISSMGWDFRVAPDAEWCPLAATGIVRLPSDRQSVGGSRGGDMPSDNPAPRPGGAARHSLRAQRAGGKEARDVGSA